MSQRDRSRSKLNILLRLRDHSETVAVAVAKEGDNWNVGLYDRAHSQVTLSYSCASLNLALDVAYSLAAMLYSPRLDPINPGQASMDWADVRAYYRSSLRGVAPV